MRHLLCLAIPIFCLAPVEARDRREDIPVRQEDVPVVRQYPLSMEADWIVADIKECSTCSEQQMRDLNNALVAVAACRQWKNHPNGDRICKEAEQKIHRAYVFERRSGHVVISLADEFWRLITSDAVVARNQMETVDVIGAIRGIDPAKMAIDEAKTIGKKIVPNNLACVKAAANPNYTLAISFMYYAKDNGILKQAGVTNRDTCMAKRDQIAEAAADKYGKIGRESVNAVGECACKQVY